MKLKSSIEQFKTEIVSLEGAIAAIKAEHVRPSNPIADAAFSILLQNLATIEFDQQSREFEREKARRIDAFEESLKQMRSQLAEKESELAGLEKTAAEGLAKLQGHADRVNQLVEKFKANYQKEVEEMNAIAAEIELASLEIYNTRPLFVRFEKAELPFALVDNHSIVILAEREQYSYNKPKPQPIPYTMPAPLTKGQKTEMWISQTCFNLNRQKDIQQSIEEFRSTGKVPAWLNFTTASVKA
jgi:uncharacterized coiled-coil protein SlyX